MLPNPPDNGGHPVENTPFVVCCVTICSFRHRGSTVEQLICNQWVAGSIPVGGSRNTQVRRLNVWPAFIYKYLCSEVLTQNGYACTRAVRGPCRNRPLVRPCEKRRHMSNRGRIRTEITPLRHFAQTPFHGVGGDAAPRALRREADFTFKISGRQGLSPSAASSFESS